MFARARLAPPRIGGVDWAASGPGPQAQTIVTSPHRRSNYDVTDTVQVSSPEAVREAVLELYASSWPGAELDALARAVDDFARLFTGRMPGYVGVDTVYHDLQHSLDVVLATARLLDQHKRET